MESLDKLFELIQDRCDLMEIVDLCQLDAQELVEILRSHIIDNRRAFESYLDIYEDNLNDL